MSATVVMLQLCTRVLHAPGPVHAVARCGEPMVDPWACGPSSALAEHATWLCRMCYPGGVLEADDGG